jgi:hypothetical protein
VTGAAAPTTAELIEEARRAAESIVAWITRAMWVVLLVGIAALVVEGANRPDDPYLVRPDGTVVDR